MKRVKFLSAVMVFSLSVLTISDVWAENAALILHFDKSSGSLAPDSSGNFNQGILENMNDSCWVKGKTGNALKFNGKDAYVRCEASKSLNITGPMRIEAWIKPAELSKDSAILAKWDNVANKYSYLFRIDRRSRKLEFNISNTKICVHGSTPLLTDKWHHVTAVYYPGKYMRIYLNFKLDGEKTSSVPKMISSNPNLDTFVGAYKSGENQNNQFNGIIDELYVTGSFAEDQPVNIDRQLAYLKEEIMPQCDEIKGRIDKLISDQPNVKKAVRERIEDIGGRITAVKKSLADNKKPDSGQIASFCDQVSNAVAKYKKLETELKFSSLFKTSK
ncbi:MAG: LamG domain-containing protein [Victivallaceae bacterium]|nr:LamG domain-containing protein [Victivallaceae bacterium]